MRRWWWAGTLVSSLIVAALIAGLIVLLQHEPGYYRRAEVPPGPRRTQLSEEFYRQVSTLLSLLNDPEPDRPWQLRLTQEQVNSYLAEGFIEAHLDRTELPRHIRELRVAFDADTVLVGFRYGRGSWSVVVSVELRLWTSAHESDTVMVQVRRVRVGAIPVPVRYVQELLAQALRRRNLEIQWYRHEGLPVAVVRFQSSRRAPTFRLENLRVEPGQFLLQGRTLASSN
jgi:hypothetical protein